MKQLLNNKIFKVVLAVVILISFLVLIYFIFIQDKTNEIVYQDYVIADGHFGQVEKYDSSYTVDGYKGDLYNAYYITGNITAKENKDFTVITFNLFDEKDNLLGTAVAGIEKMDKGKSYEFKALSLVENTDVQKIDHYEIKSIELGN